MPRTTNKYAKLGLAYEKKVGKALNALARKLGARVELQPWFSFTDAHGYGQAVPDALFHIGDQTLVIEIKYTYVIDASIKLRALYLPVVAAASKYRVRPLIICKRLTPEASNPVLDFRSAFDPAIKMPTLQWLGSGAISW